MQLPDRTRSVAGRDPLQRSYLFSALSEQQLERLRKGVSRIRVEEKQLLVHCGQEFESFYQVVEGMMKLSRISAGGDEKIMQIIKPGNIFGAALMFLDKKRYPVNAEAVRASEVLAIRAALFMEILRESPETCFKIMGHLSRQLSCHVSNIDGLCLQSAPCRLVRYLMSHLPDEPGAKPEVRLEIPKHMLASHISVQPETLSRILRDLSEKGIIEVERRRIRILDLQALKDHGSVCET
ncbi:MAG: Crp/Fnr family transcriptional regulator [Magnetococcales bacterium]|nr:Crp/Fnr family transcriptional regulator [Magnetococcales bacterium]